MGGYLTLLIPLIIALVAIAWGFVIKLSRVRARFICVLICFVVALIAAFGLRGVEYADIVAYVEPQLAGAPANAVELWNFVQSSEPLQKVLTAGGGAVIAPLVFFCVFITLAVVTWVIGAVIFIISLLFPHKKKKAALIRIPLYAIAQVILTFFVILTPVAAYIDAVPDVLDAGIEMQLIPNDELGEGVNMTDVKESIDATDQSPILKTYRVLGGKLFCNSLTTFSVGEEKTTLSTEISAISKFAAHIYHLTGTEVKDFGEKEAEIIKDLNTYFGESLMLPTVAGEVIYGATDAWLNENQAFIGMEKPSFDDPNTAMFAESFDHMLEAFHGDARQLESLCKDFDTLANMVSILAKDGVFASMNEPGTDAIVNKLSSGTTIQSLIVELGKNQSFKILISDITNIGMRAIGSSLKIPENADQIYQEFTDDIANAMNTLNSGNKTPEEKKQELTGTIRTAFEKSGTELNLDDSVLGLYADTLIEDFKDLETVTSNDVAEFFQVFAEATGTALPDLQANAGGSSIALGSFALEETQRTFTSPAYAGKTLEQLKKESAAGMLAGILKDVVSASLTAESDEAFQTEVSNILKTSYENYEKANNRTPDPAKAEAFANAVKVTKTSVTEETLTKTAGMESPEKLKKVTVKVTMEDLLTNSAEAVEKLNSDEAVKREADAIQAIFGSASDIMDQLNQEPGQGTDHLQTVAGNIGAILDNLSETGSVGDDKTGSLLIAIFQSETVLEGANLDMKTATELAQAAIKKNPDGSKNSYTDTMESLSTGANIADKLAKEDGQLTEEEIRDMLEHMTPQTADMLKIYMSEDRVSGFGVPEDKVGISTELLQNMLIEMGDKAKYGDSYDRQTKGILKIFNMASAASKSNSTANHLFNRSNDKGLLDATADEVVVSILEADMVCNAVVNTLNKDGHVEVNPFGLHIPEGNPDYLECKAAIENYYRNNTDKTEELKVRLDTVAALLGVTGIDYTI